MSFIGEPGSRLLRTAVFAIGVCAAKHGETEADTLVKEALPSLVKRVEEEAAIDNAVAAALKICCHCHKSLSDTELFHAVEKVMNRLPLEHDEEEMKTVGDLLFHFLLLRPEERVQAAVLGPNGENRAKIFDMLKAQWEGDPERAHMLAQLNSSTWH
ncbi:uncharacterized protein ACA1_222750 [Acanthamoeba castellanii str. Neff]|uniref:Uncharacterized protein n=1 Tax=Acanthamoeba castellanii (strain ATCC 30010 / Neff) TaxID=1257118 RepID=L8GS55_ACACF|nr:uncharacterized protein ACA1_222750 [Acanthamoeba castellanii str. Neff]ELR16009.1 hypothetical protein ACA1_222750 [Acanthamoeba castellanii str. Neff]